MRNNEWWRVWHHKLEIQKRAHGEQMRLEREGQRAADTLGKAVDRLEALLAQPVEPAPDEYAVPLPTQNEMDCAIAWLIYSTNHEHGPCVRYGTVDR